MILCDGILCYVMLCVFTAWSDMLCDVVMVWYVVRCYVMRCIVMLGYVMLCHDGMLWCVTLCYVM